MDPQQFYSCLFLLRVSWKALERAGIMPSTLRGSRTRVFAEDVAAACDHVPLHPDSTPNIVIGPPDHHVIHRFPYRERLRSGRTEDGTHRCASGGGQISANWPG